MSLSVAYESGNRQPSVAIANTSDKSTWSTWSHDKSMDPPHDCTWYRASPPNRDQFAPGGKEGEKEYEH